MKYHNVLPPTNNNVTHQHPVREFVYLLGALAGLLLLLYWLLGFFIDFAVDSISPQSEIALYQATSMSQLFEADEKIQPTTANESVGKLLAALAQCTDIGYPIDLSIKEAPQMNALAWPGGHIVVLSGLLDKVKSQNGLAFVLAHELAHFKNRDHLRAMGRGVILLAVSSLIGGSDTSALIIQLTDIGSAQFSQQSESAADATALDILNCHYGHIGGALEFFQQLEQQDRTIDFSLMHYFSSHPQVKRRIATLEQLGRQRGYKSEQTINWQK
ncbi:MAG: Zn-dependent protease with chaperone function [Alteromonadaceae bacterium]|jgi:Zn-dependent protease with chaperone function